VIDDDPDDVFLIEEMFSDFHLLKIQSEHCPTAAEAKTRILEKQYDLFFVDYDLGDLTGLDLIRFAREQHVDQPFIMLTGHGNYELDREAMATGAAEFIPKNELQPFFLERTIGHVLERHQVMQELQRSNLEKSRYMAKLSHEIRTPLSGIIGLSSLLGEQPLSMRQREYLNMIEGATKTLLELITDILDFTKIESGQVELEHASFNLLQTAEEILKLAAFSVPKKGIDIALNWHRDLPETVKGDPLRLRQILLNLVNNAIKFTEHGEVIFEIYPHSGPTDPLRIGFRIKDTGIGLSEDEQKRIFNAFEQANKSVSRRFGGTGLGLSICKNLVEVMGGQLEVESELGVGSTFQFDLPLEAVRSPMASAPLPSTLNVLLVGRDSLSMQALQKVCDYHRVQWRVVDEFIKVPDFVRDAHSVNQLFKVVILFDEVDKPGREMLLRKTREQGQVFFRALRISEKMENSASVDTHRMIAIEKPILPSTFLNALQGVLDTVQIGKKATRSREDIEAIEIGSTKKVLIVEDNPVNQLVLGKMIGRLGYRHEMVSDAEKALKMLQSSRFDLVLLDLELPGMSGYEAVDHIRELREDLPILALTAHTSEITRSNCKTAGMNDVLHKPIGLKKLEQALSEWL
jgi:signal transduction histidine kinase